MSLAQKPYKDILKTLFGAWVYYAGVFFLIRAWNNFCGRRLTIVTYHRVTPKPLDEIDQSLPTLFITEETFRKHLTFYNKHYKIVRFSDLVGYAKNKAADIPYNLLMITFDDGYEDNILYGAPILSEYKAPWTLFVATDKVGKKEVMWWDRMFALLTHLARKQEQEQHQNQSEASPLPAHFEETLTQFCDNPSALFARFNRRKMEELHALIRDLQSYCALSEEALQAENSFLNWDQARKLYPHADVASHACSHTALTGMALTEVAKEMSLSKEMIQNDCHREPIAFSYPAGIYTKEIAALVPKAGYTFAVTQDRGVNCLTKPYTLKRINLWEGSANLSSGEFSSGFFSFRMLGIL